MRPTSPIALVGVVASVALLVLGQGTSIAVAQGADVVFERVADLVVQVRVIDLASNAKQSLGSGFYVTTDGHLVTNYHVVAEFVEEPDLHRLEVIEAADESLAATLLAIDVKNDLAVLATGVARDRAFAFATDAPPKGTRIYSLGNPHDLGSSIVEGTYNGIASHSLYGRIHLTAPINSGMSGGPAITKDQLVVGVNVASAGNDVGFLVPAEPAHQLVTRVTAADFEPSATFWDDVVAQLVTAQDDVARDLFATPFRSVELGPYALPGELAEFLTCWGHTKREEERPYEITHHHCSLRETVYVTSDVEAASIGFQHRWLRSDELSALQFSSLYDVEFTKLATGRFNFDFLADDDQRTDRKCTTDFIAVGDGVLKAVLCLRGYHKLRGLYDFELQIATLDATDSGIHSKLSLEAISFDSGLEFVRRYLDAIRWKS